jgi:hypothetical protein
VVIDTVHGHHTLYIQQLASIETVVHSMYVGLPEYVRVHTNAPVLNHEIHARIWHLPVVRAGGGGGGGGSGR